MTVSQKPSGKYYVSVSVDCEEQEKLPRSENEIGIDLGIKDLAIAFDGRRIPSSVISIYLLDWTL